MTDGGVTRWQVLPPVQQLLSGRDWRGGHVPASLTPAQQQQHLVAAWWPCGVMQLVEAYIGLWSLAGIAPPLQGGQCAPLVFRAWLSAVIELSAWALQHQLAPWSWRSHGRFSSCRWCCLLACLLAAFCLYPRWWKAVATTVLLQLLLGLFYFSGFALFPVRLPWLLLLAGHPSPRWWNAVATTVLRRLLLGIFYFSGFALFPVRLSLLLLLPSSVSRWWNAVATTVLLLVGLYGGLIGYQSMLARWPTLRVATGQSRFAAAAACGCSFNPRWCLSLRFELSLHASARTFLAARLCSWLLIVWTVC